MKYKLPTGISVLIALVLVAFGLLYGTWSGYRADRAEVTALLERENGLMDVLDYRAADGFNLCVVARRHLNPGDEALTALESAANALRSESDLAQRCAADKALASAVEAVSAKLGAVASFQQSTRDQNYLTMLTSDLNNLSSSAAVAAYNREAQAFNQELSESPVGALAKLLGMEICPLYE